MNRRSRAEQLEDMLNKLIQKREKNVNRYIIKLDLKISQAKDKIKKHYLTKHNITP